MSHLCSIADLSKKDINIIFALADQLRTSPPSELSQHLSQRILANLFFEPSTRTRLSFESAAKQLGMHVLTVNEHQSSRVKGESFLDTLLTLQAVGAEVFVIRSKDQNVCQEMATQMSALHPNTHIINAGGGTLDHPTQGLLDVYTMLKHKPDLSNCKITIIGDLKHSRVARSTTQCLKKLGVNNIHLVAPEHIMPDAIDYPDCDLSSDTDTAITGADVVMALRIQKERMQSEQIPDHKLYHERFGVNQARLKLAKTDAIVMHPGPMNRGIEITSDIADSRQSVITEQVNNGLFIRMALFNFYLNQ